MTLRPLDDRIIVQRIDEGEQKVGGIIIPDSAKEKPQQGTVIAVGNGKANDKGKRIVKAKYPGLHAFRHFFASWCINRKVDAGLELPLKVVQERLGHSSITLTADRYGHLFPSGDDGSELAVAERAFFE